MPYYQSFLYLYNHAQQREATAMNKQNTPEVGKTFRMYSPTLDQYFACLLKTPGNETTALCLISGFEISLSANDIWDYTPFKSTGYAAFEPMAHRLRHLKPGTVFTLEHKEYTVRKWLNNRQYTVPVEAADGRIDCFDVEVIVTVYTPVQPLQEFHCYEGPKGGEYMLLPNKRRWYFETGSFYRHEIPRETPRELTFKYGA